MRQKARCKGRVIGGRLQAAFLLLLALALLGWVLAQLPLGQVRLALRQLSVANLLTLLLLNGLVLLVLNGRWWLIVRGMGYRLPFQRLLLHRLAAFGVSYFTPGPHFGGEPLQVALVEREHGVARETAVAAVTLDKLLELLVNFLFLALGVGVLLWHGFLGAAVGWQTAVFPLALVFGISLFLLATWRGQYPIGWLLRRLEPLPFWGPRARRVGALLQASERQATAFCQHAPRAMLLALLISLFAWLLMVVEYALMLRFLAAPLTLAQTLAMLTAARLAYLLPLPGGLGALEASQVLMLQLLGFDLPLAAATAVSASLLIRVRDVLLGLAGLAWAGNRWRRAYRPDEANLRV